MIGEKLGPYTILEIVGSGSIGTVYKAEDPRGRQVALKLVRAQFLNTMERREHFLRHALEASELRHQNICPIWEIGDDNNDFFIVMPFISGITLEQYMEMNPLPFTQALDIALAAGSAIEAIHNARAVHRRLKPRHIWVLDHRATSVLLTDCCLGQYSGTAKRESAGPSRSSAPLADTALPLGAVAYMSPEQIRGEALDHRTDIFSFGVVLYEMLSGRHPFGVGNSLPLITAILEAKPLPIIENSSAVLLKLESILHHALAKNREERYQSIRAMLDEIKPVREGAFLSSVPARAQTGIRKWLDSKFRRRL